MPQEGKVYFTQPLTEQDFEKRFDQLFSDAALADKQLGKFMAEVCKLVPGAIKHADLKKEETTREKLARGGAKKDPNMMLDIARASLLYDDLAGVYAAREFINHRPECAGVHDRFEGESPVESGYRDVKYFLKVQIKRANGTNTHHFCELQLHVKSLNKAGPVNHPIYEITRLAPKNPNDATTVPGHHVAKLAYELRSAWVWMKQHGMRLEDPEHLKSFKATVARFFDDQMVKPLDVEVSIPPAEVAVLKAISPYIYKFFMDKALRSKVMMQGQLLPAISQAQKKNLKAPKAKNVLA